MTHTAQDISIYASEACGVYFLRCGGAVPEESLKIIRRILKSMATPGLVTTALHRVSSDLQALCIMLEDGEEKYPSFPFAREKADAIFAFYQETSALSKTDY